MADENYTIAVELAPKGNITVNNPTVGGGGKKSLSSNIGQGIIAGIISKGIGSINFPRKKGITPKSFLKPDETLSYERGLSRRDILNDVRRSNQASVKLKSNELPLLTYKEPEKIGFKDTPKLEYKPERITLSQAGEITPDVKEQIRVGVESKLKEQKALREVGFQQMEKMQKEQAFASQIGQMNKTPPPAPLVERPPVTRESLVKSQTPTSGGVFSKLEKEGLVTKEKKKQVRTTANYEE